MKFGILSDIHGYPPLEEDRKELYTCDVVCLCGDVFEGRLLEDFANDQIIDSNLLNMFCNYIYR